MPGITPAKLLGSTIEMDGYQTYKPSIKPRVETSGLLQMKNPIPAGTVIFAPVGRRYKPTSSNCRHNIFSQVFALL